MEYDYELYEMLQEAVDEGSIEVGTPAYGVALQLIESGHDSLTDKQKWVYENHVVPHFKKIDQHRIIDARKSGMPD